jgi:hypothetical protein
MGGEDMTVATQGEKQVEESKTNTEEPVVIEETKPSVYVLRSVSKEYIRVKEEYNIVVVANVDDSTEHSAMLPVAKTNG